MAVTIKQVEGVPPLYMRAEEAQEAVWRRIEAYVVYRWAARPVEWIVEGPGEWVPPLIPAAIAVVEVWSSADEWESTTLTASPLGGYWLPATGPYRFLGSAGDGDPAPPDVMEAFRRLFEYIGAESTITAPPTPDIEVPRGAWRFRPLAPSRRIPQAA